MVATDLSSTTGRSVALLVWFAVAAMPFSSCRARPEAGEACRGPHRLFCGAPDRALVCDAPTWREVPCRGPRGCIRRPDGSDDCDDTLASEGDPCPPDPAVDYACATERSAALVCRDGHFRLWRRCRGGGGCSVSGARRLDCDTSLSEPNDPCEREGSFACYVDHQTMVECNGRAFVPASTCRGPRGCRVDAEPRKVECDDGIALEGDPCREPNRIACGVDRRSELVCVGKTYAKKRECRRTDCRVDGSELYCD
jgi:hypothetical protein